MSGPQGSDPTQPWPGQQPEPGRSSRRASRRPTSRGSRHPAAEQPTNAAPQWQQPPAYDPQQQQYPQYQQPQQPAYQPPQQYPPTEQFGQQPTEYGPQAYPQPVSTASSPASTASSTASRVRPVRPTARSIRPAARAVRAARPVRAVRRPGLRRGFQALAGGHRRRDRAAGRDHRRHRAGARLLEARLLRHHQARRRRGADRCAADPDRRGQRLRRQERQGRQVQRRSEPDGQEGRHLQLRGQHRRHQASGDGDVPGRQTAPTRSAGPSSGASRFGRPSSAFCSRPIDDVTPYCFGQLGHLARVLGGQRQRVRRRGQS